MKIGIISSGTDTLALFKFLTRYDHEYLVYCDQKNFPYGEKSLDCVLERIQQAGEFLLSKGAEVIVVDPIYELVLKYSDKKIGFQVLPLFQHYLHEYGFKYSLVGKFGILTDFGSAGKVQLYLENESQNYEPTVIQCDTKKFSFSFHFRVKSASSWTSNINDLGVHNPFVIRTMKNDLRYFKDAYVDTILPMHYQYFRMQRAIKSFFNFHKIRFHDFSVIEDCFDNLTGKEKSEYSVSLWINQPSCFLMRDKQLLRLMQRGKSVKVSIQEI